MKTTLAEARQKVKELTRLYNQKMREAQEIDRKLNRWEKKLEKLEIGN